jgi:hypothetical protein
MTTSQHCGGGGNDRSSSVGRLFCGITAVSPYCPAFRSWPLPPRSTASLKVLALAKKSCLCAVHHPCFLGAEDVRKAFSFALGSPHDHASERTVYHRHGARVLLFLYWRSRDATTDATASNRNLDEILLWWCSSNPVLTPTLESSARHYS